MSKNRSSERIIGTWVGSGTDLSAAFGLGFGDVAIAIVLGGATGMAIGESGLLL